MDAKRSGLDPPGALACGAGLGIAAIIAISVIVDAAPPWWDEPMGEAFSVLAVGLVLLLVVRLLAARFSPAIRALVAAHKFAHTAALGAAIIIVAYVFLFGPSYGDQWGIQWLQQQRRDGCTLPQWLNTLATEPGRSGSPLDIIRTHVYTNLHTTVLEVPLSYDLLREHGFVDRFFLDSELSVTMDGVRGWPVPTLRGTNGNCLLPLNWDEMEIPPGLHQFEVRFIVADRMRAYGSTQAVVFANEPRSGSPLDIVRTRVDTNLQATVLELPLSYELLREPNFLNGHGKITLDIDDRPVGHSIRPVRGANGNCLLVLNWDREQIPPGLHKVQVELCIGRYLLADGPTRTIAFDNDATSH